jgi:hypothetical protein
MKRPKNTSLLRHVLRSVPLMVILSVATYVAESRGWFRGFESVALDA